MKNSFKIIFTLCVMLSILWQPYYSQAQTSYSYGTSASEIFRRSAVNPTDNSFLAGGFEDASIDPGLLVNIDNTGSINWAKKYAHTQSMDLMDIHMNDNGNAVVLFRTINTASNVNRRDALLMEVDASGIVQWSKTYVNTTREVRLTRITALSSGDYILTGNASHNISTSYNNYYLTMMRVDATGNKLWVRRDLNNNSNNMAISGATESADGNLLIAGHMWHTINNNGNYHNGYVAKIDVSDGSTTWNKEYPSSDEVNFHQLEELASGDIIVAGKIADSHLSGFPTSRLLFLKINSTGTVLISKEYAFPNSNIANSFKMDAITGNIFFAGIEAATSALSDRDNYWIELTEDGDFVDAYKYTLPDYEGNPMLNINDVSINIMTTTKSFLADPAATANNDFAMFLVDRNNPLEDCNISQFTAEATDFTFDALEGVTLNIDNEFSLTESTVTLSVDATPFLQADICFEEEPLTLEGTTTDEYCALSTGTVDITVGGGLAPYLYLWSNGATTEDLSGVVGGAYNVTVTDDNGATITDMFIVQANDMLVTASQTDCDGMGTSDTSDDLITIAVNALYNYTVGPTSSMYNVYDDATNTLLGTFSYPVDGDITVTYTPTLTLRFEDFDNAECFKHFTLDLDSCSPMCSITGTLFQEGCDNMGNCDPSDDLVILYVDATTAGGGPSGLFNAVDINTYTLLGTFPYNGGGTITIPYTSSVTIGYEDFDDPSCFTDASVELLPCDPEEATFTCPGDIFTALDGTGCEAVVDYVLDYDDCGGEYVLTLVTGLPSGSSFPLGTTVITYELSNGATTITCSFNVNVSTGTTLYAMSEGYLASLDITTGDVTQIVPLSMTYTSFSGLTYDPVSDKLLFVANSATNPRLASIDRLTGTVTEIGDIDEASLDIKLIESMQYNPDDGLLYAAGAETNFIDENNSTSGRLMTVDPLTGNATYVAMISGTGCSNQDDGDIMGYGPGVQLLGDGCPNPTGLHTFDVTTGVATFIGNYTGSIGLAVDQLTSNVFTLKSADRQLAIISTTDATFTTIGTTHTSAEFNDQTFRRLTFAPTAIADIMAVESVTDTPCNTIAGGSIDLMVTGGVPAYTYVWSTGATTEDVTGLTAGVHAVTITDACGNTLEKNYTVGEEDGCCDIIGTIFQEGCDNMGTCDPSDDVIYVYIDVTNGSSTGMFNVVDASTGLPLGVFPYNGGSVITIPYSPFISVIFSDVLNPECVTEGAIDLQPCGDVLPTLTCPDDIFTVLDGTGCDVVVDYIVDYDDCGGEYVLTLIEGLASGSTFPLGTTVVTYELSNGTTTITCSFNVNVSNVAPTAGDFITVEDASAQGNNCFELTPDAYSQAGAMWYQKKLNLDYDFELNFDINLGADGPYGADGMMFILQPLNTAIGGNGGNLGFSGVSPSVGIEFDTYYNGQLLDPSNDHISFQKNGVLKHDASGYLDPAVVRNPTANMENNTFQPVTIKWNATTKELTYIYVGGETATVTQDIVNTIFGGNPNVFWGWAAGTASRKNQHQVCVNDISFTESITADAIITDVPCGGNGMIDLTVSGGVAPYTFIWSDNSTGEDLNPITMGGVYSVTITDACGNEVVEEYTVEEEECPCTITGTLFMEGCDNQGTCDPSDDLIYLYLNATVINGGASGMFTAMDQTTATLLGTFAYNSGGVVTIPYTPFISVIFADVDNPECNMEVAIDLQPCSDGIDPTITCPDDIFTVLDGTGCDVVVDYTIDYDDCGGEYVLTLIEGLASGSAFPLGTTTVTYELSNGTTTITCSFNVNVSNVAPTAGDFITVEDASAQGNNCFELTPDAYHKAGAVWYQKKMNLDYDFELNFDINLGADGPYGADGMMFILQPLNTAIGGDGGNLGFSGVSPSIGVEFDTYYNGQFLDPTNDHISIQKNGILRHDATGYLDATVVRNPTANMENNTFQPVTIKWNATTKELTYIYVGGETATVTQDIVNTIFGGNPNVFWGWAAGTASRKNQHQVCVNDISFTESITADAIITEVPCEEGAGMIDLTVSGGVAPYTFAWSDNSTGEDLDPITMGGVYSVTITDACGNMIVEEYTVEQEACPCTMTGTLIQEGCDGMNTVDVSDDLIYLYVDVTVVNPGASGMFNVVDASTFMVLGTYAYGSPVMITVPYAPSISLIYEDVDNADCNTSVAIDMLPCSPTCTDVNITITLDNYPKETSWDLKDGLGNVILSSNGHLGQNPDGTVISVDTCLVDDCYEFTIYDSYGDGICCNPYYGNGSYSVTDLSTNTVLGSGGQFGFSETTNFCFGDVTPPCTYEVVKNNTFEGGWGIWNDGGDNAERIQSTGIGTAGNWSIRLRNGTNTSVMTTNDLNLAAYAEVTVDLMYQARSMDSAAEGFELEMSTDGGATFTFVEEWNQGDEFTNGVNQTDAVVIPGPFTATTQFRFKCVANGNFDFVYFDKIIISGCVENASRPTTVKPTKREDILAKPDFAITNLYPNPAQENVNIEYDARIEGKVDIAIYNTVGQLVLSEVVYAQEGENLIKLEIDRLMDGTYMVEINDGKKKDIEKLVIIK